MWKRWEGERTYFVGTGDYAGEFVSVFALTFDHGLDEAGVVGAQIDKAVSNAGIPEGLEKGARRCVHVVAVSAKKAKRTLKSKQNSNLRTGTLSIRQLYILEK